jgi:PBSX family phage terminase large subunit
MELEVKAHDAQIKFLNLDSRYRGFIGGVGSGKTYAGSLYSLQRIQRSETLGVIATRTYPMLRDVVVRQFLDICPEEYIDYYNKQEMRIKFQNDSEVLFRPLEQDRQIDKLRGLTINWFWIDEAAYVDEYAFEVLQARLRQGEHQAGAITTTPAGKNWVYDKFIEGDSSEYKAVSGVSSFDNPFLPEDYTNDLEDEYSAEYLRQEVYAEFVKFQGLVYKEFRREDNCLSRDEVEDLDISEYIYGYDAGYRNPRALVKIGITPNDRYVVLDEFYQREVRLSNAIERFREMYDGGIIYADPSAKGEIEELKKAGFRVEAGDNEVSAGIQKLKELFASRNLLLSERVQNTLNEINSYRWSDDETKDEPLKENDHAMDALRYAVFTRESGPSGDGSFVFE